MSSQTTQRSENVISDVMANRHCENIIYILLN